MTALLARLVGTTLRKHPLLNARYNGKEAQPQAAVHLGIATALGPGLAVPVIHDVEKKTLTAIQNELTVLAREGLQAAHELDGGTFTLLDFGRYGIAQCTAPLNPPEVALLALGAVQQIREGVGGDSVPPMLWLTLVLDPRAVDPATGASFLAALKEGLERPYRLLV
jgi:pyruvate dehydrogenase E2 component (dihydrolipoamide acetyltransferase)